MFTSHPKNVCMTYFSHLKFSFYISLLLLKGSYRALIHAFFPFLYIKSSTELVILLEKKLDETGCKNKIKNDL